MRKVNSEDLKRTVARAAKGERPAAAALFDHYHPRIYRYAVAKLRDPITAEDVASETFAKALKELKRFRWKGAGFEAWLFRIASNQIVDSFRRSGRELPSEGIAEEHRYEVITGPETAVVERERAERLSELVAKLPEDQREVIHLRFAAGLSCAEAAKVMGRSSSAVRQIQFRAVKKLRTWAAEREPLT